MGRMPDQLLPSDANQGLFYCTIHVGSHFYLSHHFLMEKYDLTEAAPQYFIWNLYCTLYLICGSYYFFAVDRGLCAVGLAQ